MLARVCRGASRLLLRRNAPGTAAGRRRVTAASSSSAGTALLTAGATTAAPVAQRALRAFTVCAAAAAAAAGAAVGTARRPAARAEGVASSQLSSEQQQQQPSQRRLIRGVIFDLDGTLTLPHAIDFARMRQRLGIAPGADPLALVHNGNAESRAYAVRVIEEEERFGAERAVVQPGFSALFAHITQTAQLPHAILTRNSEPNVHAFLNASHHAHITLAHGVRFDPIVTRDCPHGFKPSPQPILYIASQWSLPPSQCLMVGDSADDMSAGQRAGALTCLMRDDGNAHLVARFAPTYVIDSLEELIPILKAAAATDADAVCAQIKS